MQQRDSGRQQQRTPRLLSGLIVFCTFSCAQASSFRRWSSYVAPTATDTCPDAVSQSRVPSGMWGCQGEKWDSTGKGPLTDWSFAGYGAGLETIPDAPVTHDLMKDFNAAGDGKTDDTAAVLAALNATEQSGGVIYLPPGKYLLSQQLNLSSNQVLRGAGKDLTTLYFNTSLEQLYGWGPNHVAGMETSPYTWAGGLISTQRKTQMFKPWHIQVGSVAKPASRGDRRLYITLPLGKAAAADQALAVGQWIALSMYETPDAALAIALCNNRTVVGNRLGKDFGNRMMFAHMSRVAAVGQDWVELERPLHVDVSMIYKPTLYRTFNFRVTGVGIEDLEIAFPWTAYLGHHEEPGYNAIEFEGAVNSWIRRIKITNADAGIKLYSSFFNTISDVEINNVTPRPRRGGRWNGRVAVMQEADKDGHIGIALHWGCFDNLVEKFNITGLFYHELLVAGYSAHNVLMGGSGSDLCLDHHGGAPHNNLWTDIDLGSGLAAMHWSGDPQHFPYAGSSNVFWNIWASKIPIPYDYIGRFAASNLRVGADQRKRTMKIPVMNRPAKEQGYAQVVVDMPVDGQSPPIQEAGDWYIWYKPSQRIWPPNLYKGQRSTPLRSSWFLQQGETLSQLTDQKLPTAMPPFPLATARPATAVPTAVGGNNQDRQQAAAGAQQQQQQQAAPPSSLDSQALQSVPPAANANQSAIDGGRGQRATPAPAPAAQLQQLGQLVYSTVSAPQQALPTLTNAAVAPTQLLTLPN